MSIQSAECLNDLGCAYEKLWRWREWAHIPIMITSSLLVFMEDNFGEEAVMYELERRGVKLDEQYKGEG